MTETPSVPKTRSQVIQAIEQDALQLIETHYHTRPYHNRGHAEFVKKEAEILMNELGLKTDEIELGKLVSICHDFDQTRDAEQPHYEGHNEKASADWLITQMKAKNDEGHAHGLTYFSSADMDAARHAILATQAQFDDPTPHESGWSENARIYQQADPDHLLSQILCDADLSNLGSEWDIYWRHMSHYYRERHPDGGQLDDWTECLKMQVPILLHHQYYTEPARRRYHHLKSNAHRIQDLLHDPESLQASYEEAKV